MIKLVIGNKNYSSWSMRAWLCLHAFNVEFEEILESFIHVDIDERLSRYSASAKVPALVDHPISVWDSIAIAEYIAENYAIHAWPKDKHQRANARAISAEMHSSFYHLKKEMPMNIRALRRVELSNQAESNIKYIDKLWANYASQSKGGWLFDTFSIADCMYAPVASRFQTYAIELTDKAKNYQQKLLAHPSVIAWSNAARKETEIVEFNETGTPLALI